jgi:two-component system phosphate regulon response regulator PhoB/two-component system alkaline phosphatase synthesis response regulator PhoP
MKKKIAIVDDEPDILQLAALNLEKAGYSCVTLEDGRSLFSYLEKEQPALIVLDLMLPDFDGFDICRMLRGNENTKNIPIIMFTARGESTDKVIGLEMGADDYLDKMSSPRELVARVKAVLRRTSPVAEGQALVIGNILKLDLNRYQVLVEDQPVKLTTTEFNILKLLAKKPGWVFSRNQILDHLWGNDKIVIDRTIDVHIRNLRDKLGKAGKLLKNVRGVGYKLENGS